MTDVAKKRIPKPINPMGIRTYGEFVAKIAIASNTKIPKAAKKIPSTEYILVKLTLRLAKIQVLFGNSM
jgi:hypothetical protein